MCNCLKETEDKLREKMTSEDFAKDFKPRKATELRFLHPKNTVLMIRSGEWRLNIPYEATWTLENGKSKETIINILASHCPFCGASFEPESSVPEQPESDKPSPLWLDSQEAEDHAPRCKPL